MVLQERGDGHAVGREERFTHAVEDALLQPRPPTVAAGEEAVPRGGADG
jgi:hypothetical protein